jgi:hypothetical protein
MYDSAQLVNTFLADPQRRLAFREQTDEVWDLAADEKGTRLPVRQRTGLRKLFLPTHHRHYLITTSLRCDVAGFPHTRAEAVCGAGFVVRRRSVDLPGGAAGAVAKVLRRHAAARSRRVDTERRLAALQRFGVGAAVRSTALEGRLRSLQGVEAETAEAVRAWSTSGAAVRRLEGWLPTGPGTGSWQTVAELPETVTEAAYPLTALIPDPTRPDHDGAGESIWFGVVPTASSDVDGAGAARYDAAASYEIRCFVRRHRPECPPGGDHGRCPVTWSEPTEAYRLAGHFDLEGTANRPVTVQLPDLAQLRADALRLTPGGGAGVRFAAPAGSELAFTADGVDATKKTGPGAEQVCSFAIPLITIVAFFVLRLFLPIVVFVFQLWWMLALRFCVPPASLDAGLAAKIELIGSGLDVDVNAVTAVETDAAFKGELDTRLSARRGGVLLADAFRAARKTDITQAQFGAILRGVFAPGPAAPVPPPYADRVERDAVVRP